MSSLHSECVIVVRLPSTVGTVLATYVYADARRLGKSLRSGPVRNKRPSPWAKPCPVTSTNATTVQVVVRVSMLDGTFRDEDLLAFVLAHEVAHEVAQHEVGGCSSTW